MIDGYNDLSQCFLWEWKESVLGPLTFDSERTLIFDGLNFMVIKDGHPDDAPEEITMESTSLIRWLQNKVMERDPSLLNDTKWYYRTLWHEYIRITQVSLLRKEILLK